MSSGKGGVGKSTVAVNLALALKQSGAEVGLVDVDVYGPDVPLMMGAKGKPGMFENKIIPVEAHGIKIMSIGLLVAEREALVWRGPMIHSAVQQFLRDVNWGPLDYLVFDMPPGTGDAQLSLSQVVPLSGVVMVTTPQDVALLDVRKALGMFRKLNVPILGIVENMSYFIAPDTGRRYGIFGEGGGQRVADEFGVPLLGQIPLEMETREGGDAGVPITVGPARLGPGPGLPEDRRRRRRAGRRGGRAQAPQHRVGADALPMPAQISLPIFPLPDLTFFPHTLLPLHIFEARYRAMITDCLSRDRRLAVVGLKPGYEAELRGQARRLRGLRGRAHRAVGAAGLRPLQPAPAGRGAGAHRSRAADGHALPDGGGHAARRDRRPTAPPVAALTGRVKARCQQILSALGRSTEDLLDHDGGARAAGRALRPGRLGADPRTARPARRSWRSSTSSGGSSGSPARWTPC